MADATAAANGHRSRRLAWWLGGLAVLTGLVYLMATASTGPVDPTEATRPQSHATIVFNSAMIVFREGLEAVLIFAAVTASFLRRQPSAPPPGRARRRLSRSPPPSSPGSSCRPCSTPPPDWARGSRRSPASWRSSSCWSSSTGSCTRSTGRSGSAATTASAASCWRRRGFAATVVGLVALGFTSVYREGFEVVLFLQNLQLQDGSGTVLEGVAIGLAATAAVGVVTFWLHAQAALPADADRSPACSSASCSW